MKIGKIYNFGDVILANVQFTDTFEIKKRPCLVLFDEQGNIVVAGITSNSKMKGILLKKEDGAIKKSIVKLNYIFTISEKMVERFLFSISNEKKQLVRTEFVRKLS